ncbi:GNAT family N-acetyltransferase [Rhizobium sp. X9]|uniref:GNAT family N-acetyltransferase n=1 Tax=Rhizobium sp. X9 TaxID=2815360 RepID=UPI001C0E0B54|nr:GNAT family N-acetyltransferase [Rhizobium sp. X9]
MRTYVLSDAEVAAYLRDLSDRLVALGDMLPKTWYSVGISGDKVVRPLMALLPEALRDTIDVRRVSYNRSTGDISAFDLSNPDLPLSDKDFPTNAFVIDGPIHSGSTMLAIIRWLTRNGVTEIVSYGLVIKRSTDFVPSFFGLMIGEHDRAYFQFKSIPNHRLRKKGPFGVLRTLEAADAKVTKQKIDAGDNSLSEISLSDLWYAKRGKGEHVYLYELAGEFVGFVHFIATEKSLLVDALAVEDGHQGKDIGGLLLRWVENWARNHKLAVINLWAIEKELPFYRHMKYQPIAGEEMMELDGENFVKMSRRLLYNIDPEMLMV